jgi:hypothetical protein
LKYGSWVIAEHDANNTSAKQEQPGWSSEAAVVIVFPTDSKTKHGIKKK